MSKLLSLEQMTLTEKLRTMEDLWDDLRGNEEALPVPQWHKDVLDSRAGLIKAGKAQFIDWETAKKQIQRRTQ